jgi:hypothetical protein
MPTVGKRFLCLFLLAVLPECIHGSYTNAPFVGSSSVDGSSVDGSSVDGLKELYIIVHGTWATHETWAQPGGDFFEALRWSLELESRQLNADTVRRKQLLPCTAAFSWSGKNDHAERQRAAQKLATTLAALPKDIAITLIAHSHGANVCFLASQLLANTGHTITTLYALGAPIDRARYQPNMSVIGSLYNLFSFGDPVQTVSGCFERVLQPHPRITNIALACNDTRPNHAELHAPLVARWLTIIPKLCNQTVQTGLPLSAAPSNQNSAYTNLSTAYGSLSLFDNKQPLYAINNQIPTLLENEKKLYAALALYMLPRDKKTSQQG